MPLSVLINGANGRMGRALVAAAAEAGITVSATVGSRDDLASVVPGTDVIVDFSTHEVTRTLIELAIAHRKPVVIGTTGHTAAEKADLLTLATNIPCVWAGNFSIGVNLLFALTRRASSILDAGYDAEIVELHHRFKKDAPSGTADRLLEIIRGERHLGSDAVRHGREGITGKRASNEIGIHSLRGGDAVGDHTVVFAALGERIELTHQASDRAILARGALRAAKWVATQKPGVYDMEDVLGLT